jgi:hypothetical protein
MQTLAPDGELPASTANILASAYDFSRMLHSSNTGSTDAIYRAFVPELGSTLYPRQIELVKRCMRSERGDVDRGLYSVAPLLLITHPHLDFSWSIYFSWSCESYEGTNDTWRRKS